MWQVSARCVCRASSRAWQRRLPWPGPAPAAPRSRSPAWSPGTAPAQGLSSMAPSIRLSPPARSLFDEPLDIAVQGLGPRQQVTLRTSLRDETGQLFQASAYYQAGDDGELDLARCPALPGGSFSGLEPMGLLWALQPQKPFWRLVKRDVQSPFLLQLEVFEGHGERPGRLLAQAQHERVFLRDGVRRVPVRQGRIRATLFLPPGDGPFPGVIDMYGDEGGLIEFRSSLLATHGFAALSLPYFDFEDLPRVMKELKLEYFEEAARFLQRHPKVKGPGVGVIGTGKGAELALSMITFLPEVVAAVSISGCSSNTVADLHYGEMTLPGLRFDMNKVSVSDTGVFDIFEALDDPTNPANSPCVIPIEKAEGHFLLVVGEDDRMWKSSLYAELAIRRLRQHGKENFELLSYPGAGHRIDPPSTPFCQVATDRVLGVPVLGGGESKAHARAQEHSWGKIQEFLHLHLG